MRTSITFSLILLAGSAALGCSHRDPETYRADTKALLETRQASLKSCYDRALETNSELEGQVTVTFKVEKKTGRIFDTAIDPARTQAPESLGQCVVQAVDGLVLDPPDRREGQASYSWTFKANEPKQAEAPAADAPAA